jgi:hypothetical protein
MKYNFNFFADTVVDEPELWEQHIVGHVKVLIDYGIGKNTTNNQSCIANLQRYAVVNQDVKYEKIGGGFKIQFADEVNRLPEEEALGKVDNNIPTKVNHYLIKDGWEACVLWRSKSVKYLGIGSYLMWPSVCLVIQLNFSTIIGICAYFSLKLFGEIEFVIGLLKNSSLSEKELMLYLRNNLQVRMEKNKASKPKVSYPDVY